MREFGSFQRQRQLALDITDPHQAAWETETRGLRDLPVESRSPLADLPVPARPLRPHRLAQAPLPPHLRRDRRQAITQWTTAGIRKVAAHTRSSRTDPVLQGSGTSDTTRTSRPLVPTPGWLMRCAAASARNKARGTLWMGRLAPSIGTRTLRGWTLCSNNMVGAPISPRAYAVLQVSRQASALLSSAVGTRVAPEPN